MLRDRFGRNFEAGQPVAIHDAGLMEGVVLETEEVAVVGNGERPMQTLYVKMAFTVPLLPIPVKMGNIVIADPNPSRIFGSTEKTRH